MKRIAALIALICLSLSLAACGGVGDEGPTCYIEPAELSQEERDLAMLLQAGTPTIFDLELDETIASVSFRLYELKDGKWVTLSDQGGLGLEPGSARIALDFDMAGKGMQLSLSNGGAIFSTQAPAQTVTDPDMAGFSTGISQRTQILPGQELCLSILALSSAQESIMAWGVEDCFQEPQRFQGIVKAYALTATFSSEEL